jgi:hypothetical protein
LAEFACKRKSRHVCKQKQVQTPNPNLIVFDDDDDGDGRTSSKVHLSMKGLSEV